MFETALDIHLETLNDTLGLIHRGYLHSDKYTVNFYDVEKTNTKIDFITSGLTDIKKIDKVMSTTIVKSETEHSTVLSILSTDSNCPVFNMLKSVSSVPEDVLLCEDMFYMSGHLNVFKDVAVWLHKSLTPTI